MTGPVSASGTGLGPAPADGARDDVAGLRRVLRDHRPFDALSTAVREDLAAAARIERFGPGAVILDAFTAPSVDVFVVMSGQVELWSDPTRLDQAADEQLGPGRVFGFSAMLMGRSVGPLAKAVKRATVAAIPAEVVEPVFASRSGARFLAEQTAIARRPVTPSLYSLVDDLIPTTPLVVPATDSVADVARLISSSGAPCAVVPLDGGRFGLVTDAQLRQRVLVDGLPGSAPAAEVMDTSVPTVALGASAAEALMLLLDRNAEFLVVTDARGHLRGVITARDFAVSPTAAGASIDEQVRRATTVDELQQRARRVPPMLSDLLAGGLASGKVIAVHSAILDTIVRRAIVLVFDGHPDLSLDAFTWLSLGSNGRREAVPSSDIDSAAAFDDAAFDDAAFDHADFEAGGAEAGIARYRAAFAQVNDVLANAGLLSDGHGASAEQPAFARTNTAWRAAAQEWMAAPAENQGAIMTSLLVDGRPIHGDPGLPAVLEVFADLRRHPGTMRLLTQQLLSTRAKMRSVRELFSRRDTFNIKSHAVLPIVNLARLAALTVGSTVLPTVDRLRAAAGSEMLPEEQAANLIEAFEVLQRLRLRYQLLQLQAGERPTDTLVRDRLSPIDRSMVGQAVREIAAAQRRMDNLAAYLPMGAWAAREPR